MQVILVIIFIALLFGSPTFCQSLHTLIKGDKINGMDKKIVTAEVNLYDDKCSQDFY
jgi:hypothetical protein